MKSRTHKNIPIFIPHLGCPNACVFCDQRIISGQRQFSLADVSRLMDEAVATLPRGLEAEIAFFGGSFTAIDPRLMRALLDMALPYVSAGQVHGIRFSTRPDAVGEDILDLLTAYPITAIELGLQSMDDRVLMLTKRGHTADIARDACRRIVARGIPLVGQMMIGLPGSDAEREYRTAREICDLGASAARIYPTVVLRGTELACMLERGDYIPLTDTEAAVRCAPILELLEKRGVDCLRVGLCANEGLTDGSVVGGACHPALGELAKSEVFCRRMTALLSAYEGATQGKSATFLIPRTKRSQATGQHQAVLRSLCTRFGLSRVRLIECDTLSGMQVCAADEFVI